jgi:hypothetical protein
MAKTARTRIFALCVSQHAHAIETAHRCRRSWEKALKDAGLQYFWIYDLRHSAASRLTQAGVSPTFVAQIVGHSNPSILSTYARAVDEFKGTQSTNWKTCETSMYRRKNGLQCSQTVRSTNAPEKFPRPDRLLHSHYNQGF